MLAMVCWYNILDIYYIINLRNIRLLSKVQSETLAKVMAVAAGKKRLQFQEVVAKYDIEI